MTTAKIVLDSINPNGNRVVTFELNYPKNIHWEVLTHRSMSRNSSSTRAIPVDTMVKTAVDEFDYPPFMMNQKGMQADVPATGEALDAAKFIWAKAFESAVLAASTLGHLGIHKQNANRLLYPFTNISVVLTATEFENFFNLRLGADAQQEIQELAKLMKDAMDNSEPTKLKYGDWHIPYITKEELGYSLADRLITSVARTARVSYEHQGEASYLANDATLAHRLLRSGHFSPFEHQAVAEEPQYVEPSNLVGYTQLRHIANDVLNSKVWEQYNL
jgi:thymidylate synthase ThyX